MVSRGQARVKSKLTPEVVDRLKAGLEELETQAKRQRMGMVR